MTARNRTLLTVSLAGMLLITSGCTATTDAGGPPSRGTTAAPSPTIDQARTELIAAFERSQRVPHRYTVQGDLPKGQRVKGSGAVDPAAKRFMSTTEATGGDSLSSGHQILIGTDNYVRPLDDKTWVHLDMKRLKEGSLAYFDTSDPTGLVTFTTMIGSVRRTGPHAYSGRFNPESPDLEPFFPVGAPSIVSFRLGPVPFAATTDASGWVTSIVVELTDEGGRKPTMTTRMSGHGKPLQIKAPPKAATAEADSGFYYGSAQPGVWR